MCAHKRVTTALSGRIREARRRVATGNLSDGVEMLRAGYLSYGSLVQDSKSRNGIVIR
jgi:hypothetical protein